MRLHHRCHAAFVPISIALAPWIGACSSGGDDHDPQKSIEQTNSAIANLNSQTSAGLAQALADLDAAVQNDPQNGLARTLRGGVRLAAFLDDNRVPTDGSPPSELASLVEGFGIDLGGQSIFELGATLGGGTLPDLTTLLPLPEDSPQGSDVQAFLAGPLAERLRQSAADWEAVTGSFSQLVPDFLGSPVEFDYGDARLLAAAARGIEALLHLQSAFVLEADIDELANWESDGLDVPYRLYTGDSPSNIVLGQTTPSGRMAFLNEPEVTDSTNTFLPAAGANAALDRLRQALIATLINLQAGLTYVEDPDPSDELFAIDPAILCPIQLAAPWFADVLQALQGGGAIVAPLVASDPDNPDCSIELPGFTLDRNLLFSSDLWDGRLLFPDYPDGTTFADEGSWAHLLADPLFLQLIADFGGDPPSGADILGLWNLVNSLWDFAFAGEQLEESY